MHAHEEKGKEKNEREKKEDIGIPCLNYYNSSGNNNDELIRTQAREKNDFIVIRFDMKTLNDDHEFDTWEPTQSQTKPAHSQAQP